MTLPSYVNNGGLSTSIFGSPTPSLPSSRSDGNILVCWFIGQNGGGHGTITGTGWTTFITSDTSGANLTAAYYEVDGAEAAPSCGGIGPNTGHAIIEQYANVDPSTPFGTPNINSGSSTAMSGTGPTAGANNSLFVAFCFDGDSGQSSITTSTGYTSNYTTNAADVYINSQSETGPGSGNPADNISNTLAVSHNWKVTIVELLPSTIVTAKAQEDAVGSLSVSASLLVQASASLPGIGGLNVNIPVTLHGEATLPGVGGLTVDARLITDFAIMHGVSTLHTTAIAYRAGRSTMQAAGTLLARASVVGPPATQTSPILLVGV